MASVLKKVTELTLRNGTKLQITIKEGENIRKAKLRNTSSSIIIPSLNNRMVDSSFIVDIEDKMVEDLQQMLTPDANTKLLNRSDLKPADENSPGYLKFKEAQKKLRKKMGGQTRSSSL